MVNDITSTIQSVVQLVFRSVVSLYLRRDSTFTSFLFSLHPENLVSDGVEVRVTVAKSAARAGSNGPRVASMGGLPRSSKIKAFFATARLVERVPVAFLVTVRRRSRRCRQLGPIGTVLQAVGNPVPNVARVASVLLAEDISGLFFVHLRDVRRTKGRTSIPELVAELEAPMQCRYKHMELVAMGYNVAYGGESPFTTESGLAKKSYLVLVRSEVRGIVGEQFVVLNQLSQAIGMGFQGSNGHESVQVDTFEGRLDLKLACLAVALVPQDLNHLLIGHSLSVVVEEIGTSRFPVHS